MLKKKVFFYFIVVLFTISSVFAGYFLYLKFKYRNTYVVRMAEGLGEQIYEYSFGYFLQKETGRKIKYDIESIKNEDKEQYKRAWIYLNVDRFVDIDIWEVNKIEKWAIKKFTSYCSIGRCEIFSNFFYEDEFIIKNKDKFVYVDNVFKNSNYHEKYIKDLQETFSKLLDKYADEFDDKNKQMVKEMQSHKNSVAINIRLGEFLLIPALNVCNFDYYKRAMKVFDKMEDVHYYIFSDDIEGVKKHFKINKPHTFVDVNPLEKPYLNLILSSSAKHNIVSNSTFAIWAGMLNKNPNKIVVCPNKYVRDSEIFKENNLIYPKDWIKIDVDNDKQIDVNDIDTDLAKSVENNKIIKIISKKLAKDK